MKKILAPILLSLSFPLLANPKSLVFSKTMPNHQIEIKIVQNEYETYDADFVDTRFDLGGIDLENPIITPILKGAECTFSGDEVICEKDRTRSDGRLERLIVQENDSGTYDARYHTKLSRMWSRGPGSTKILAKGLVRDSEACKH